MYICGSLKARPTLDIVLAGDFTIYKGSEYRPRVHNIQLTIHRAAGVNKQPRYGGGCRRTRAQRTRWQQARGALPRPAHGYTHLHMVLHMYYDVPTP